MFSPLFHQHIDPSETIPEPLLLLLLRPHCCSPIKDVVVVFR